MTSCIFLRSVLYTCFALLFIAEGPTIASPFYEILIALVMVVIWFPWVQAIFECKPNED